MIEGNYFWQGWRGATEPTVLAEQFEWFMLTTTKGECGMDGGPCLCVEVRDGHVFIGPHNLLYGIP